MKQRLLLLAFFSAYFSFLAFSSAQIIAPKREFRGVWVATVANIDYPREGTTEVFALQEQWKNMIERHKKIGFNVIIAQVRPASDAFYPTESAPWSKYLTGKQGTAPADSFDPLKFMIEETHKQGMEFHAWFNPYRATLDFDTVNLAPNHVFRRHRDWVVRYGPRFYLNPGIPEVRKHLVTVVNEVVGGYDIDAVHFDDYFYPYKVVNEEFPDTATFSKYGEKFNDIAAWRRSNIDSLIENVSKSVKALKPHVQFGVSPFGVWRNKEQDPLGSDTRAGATTYDDLYADVIKWLKAGWIDYVIPQLYWNIGFAPADHATLVGWWGARTYERNLYVGHAAYKVANNAESAWNDPNEIPKQIQLSRRAATVQGSAYFSSKPILENRLGLRDSLAAYYQLPALIPIPPDATLKPFSEPTLLKPKIQLAQNRVRLRWKPNAKDADNQPAYYVVYRFFGSRPGDYEDPQNIIHISEFQKKDKRFQHMDFTIEKPQTYTYVVKAVNRQHIEGQPSKPRKVTLSKKK